MNCPCTSFVCVCVCVCVYITIAIVKQYHTSKTAIFLKFQHDCKFDIFVLYNSSINKILYNKWRFVDTALCKFRTVLTVLTKYLPATQNGVWFILNNWLTIHKRQSLVWKNRLNKRFYDSLFWVLPPPIGGFSFIYGPFYRIGANCCPTTKKHI